MNQPHPFDQDLTDRLHAAADAIVVDDVATHESVHDDVARGRRGLRRRRTLTALCSLGVVAVVGVGATLAFGSDGDRATPVATASDTPTPTATPSATATQTPEPADTRNAKQLLTDQAKVLEGYLDPSGTHLDTKVTGFQGSGDGLGAKLGWSVPGEPGLGMVEFFVGRDTGSVDDAFATFCDPSTPCESRHVHGVRVQVQHQGGSTGLIVHRDDGSFVEFLIDPLFGNNSLTPVESLDLPIATLVEAALDPGMVRATREQVDGASDAFGFPDLDEMMNGDQVTKGTRRTPR